MMQTRVVSIRNDAALRLMYSIAAMSSSPARASDRACVPSEWSITTATSPDAAISRPHDSNPPLSLSRTSVSLRPGTITTAGSVSPDFRGV